jgi:hypothetical protein
MSSTPQRHQRTSSHTGTTRPGSRARARPRPSGPQRLPDPRQPSTFDEHPLRPHPVIDAIASQLTGQRINAGIALIDEAWAADESLEATLTTYTRLARAASRPCTAGLWTLIAWINWRTNNRPAAWTALHLALEIDPDEDPAHYLAVLMYDQVDPRRIRPAVWR